MAFAFMACVKPGKLSVYEPENSQSITLPSRLRRSTDGLHMCKEAVNGMNKTTLMVDKGLFISLCVNRGTNLPKPDKNPPVLRK